MRTTVKLISTLGMLTLVFAITAGVAAGGIENEQEDEPAPDAGVVDGVPEAVVIQGPGGVVVAETRPGGNGGTWTCRYFAFLPGEIGDHEHDTSAPINPEPGQYVALMCFDQQGQTVHTEALYYDPTNPFGTIAAAERALLVAREQLDPPDPSMAVSPDAAGFQLVGLPSWFWLTDSWEPTSASATLAGVTSTVTATPLETSWDMGDGATIDCDGPGIAYDPTRAAASQQSDCTHMFTQSSRRVPGGAYEVTVTVTYAVAWEATTGAGGPLESITRSAATSLQVQEAQALID